MHSKYKFVESDGVYFNTSTFVGWVKIYPTNESGRVRDICRNIIWTSHIKILQ